MISFVLLWSAWANRDKPKEHIPFDKKEALAALKDARWEMPLPFIILGGIYGGFFAISEAAAITALYILIVEVFIYKEISLKELPDIAKEAMLVVGGILLIIAVSLAFTNYLIDAEIPGLLFEWVKKHIDSPITFLLFLNVFLLILGAGYFTPPVGMNLFIASYRFNRPITDIYKATIPFFFVLLAAVLIITYWPTLSLALIR